ncbi:MAG: cation:proton antiporter, partial [Rickettsiales bacterium]|nr:cation:proton antiporter [Rickettsiales bacterium]
MTFTPEILMLYIIALPVLGSVLIALAGEKRRNLREAFTLVTAGATFALLIPLAQAVMNGARPALSVAEPLPGVQLALSLEPLGMLFALVAGFLWIVTSIYAIGYMRGHNEQHQTRFYICFALAISFAMGVAFSANLLTLFVFYEMLTLSTYPLVTHAGTDKARRAGRVYLGILLGTSICFLLLAILGTWHLTGSVTFQPGGILAGTHALGRPP